MDYSKTNNNFYLSILNDKKINIELEVPYQINRLAECYKNKLMEYSQLVEHLNRLIGKEKAEYYLKLINESPDIPQLSKEFNLETTLNRTDELLKEYNKVNHQISTQQQLIDSYNKSNQNKNKNHNENIKSPSPINNYKSTSSPLNSNKNQNNNISPTSIEKCVCKEIFGKEVFNFNLMEFLSKNGDPQMSNYCNESCIYLIVKKYQDLIEYANNKIFFLHALKTSSNGFFNSSSNIGFIEFNQYMENLLHPISPMHKRVEDAIKFKIHNKKIIINKDCTPSFGFWLNQNKILYEITKDTPIK